VSHHSTPQASAPEAIEPNRKRRISRDREPIGARLDLHGMDQDRARSAVHGFIARAHADGVRAVLIITGKGALGDGVLRRRTPDWLAEAPIRGLIAGLSQAERHHGGEGALYVALKRSQRV
jgi:DNA-nicking Smr family endonuclease